MNVTTEPGKIFLNTEPLIQKFQRRDPSFSQRFNAALKDVNVKQNVADDSIQKVIKGELGIHEGMMAIGRAEVSLKLLTQIRAKAMDSYKEIMHMQI
ncbi:MAG: flagellar hook-basal body complex protein FliE [Desulfobacteraceae bacterium 4572_130]|nr:MAG: flagellar hook-basal body complex protein FliE [Desulfobacteraceae bacterium 4572_130]